jgi:hypothetical protein
MNRLFSNTPSPIDSKLLANAHKLQVTLWRDEGRVIANYEIHGSLDPIEEKRQRERAERRRLRRAQRGLPPRPKRTKPRADFSYLRELLDQFEAAEGGV